MKLEHIIKNLIQNNRIKTQSELNDILYKKGLNTTQSNISRILKKLNTVKVMDDNKNNYYIIHEKPLDINNKIRSLVFSIDLNNQNIIIKTYDCAAYLINKIINERKINGIITTVCNNESILVIPEKLEFLESLNDKIKSLFFFEK